MASVPGALFLLLLSMAVSSSVVVKGSSSSGFSGPPYSSGSGNCPRSVLRYFAFRSSMSLLPSPP